MAKANTITVKPATPVTPPTTFTRAQLLEMLKAQEQTDLQPLIDEYEQLDAQRDAKMAEIWAIDSKWWPRNPGDKISEWITAEGPKTKEEIAAQFGKGVAISLSNSVKKNKLTLTGDKYSVKG